MGESIDIMLPLGPKALNTGRKREWWPKELSQQRGDCWGEERVRGLKENGEKNTIKIKKKKNKRTTTKSTYTAKLDDNLRFITSSSEEKCVNILGKEKKRMVQLRIQRDKQPMVNWKGWGGGLTTQWSERQALLVTPHHSTRFLGVIWYWFLYCHPSIYHSGCVCTA